MAAELDPADCGAAGTLVWVLVGWLEAAGTEAETGPRVGVAGAPGRVRSAAEPGIRLATGGWYPFGAAEAGTAVVGVRLGEVLGRLALVAGASEVALESL
jgi:hypothetical protein